MTEDQVRAALQKAVDDAGSRRAFGRLHDLSVTYVCQVLDGAVPSERICTAIGIERTTTITYRRIK